MMSELYDRVYFEKGEERNVSLYTDYKWIPEKTIPLCARIIEVMNITLNQSILDFGCAKGYMVKAFRLLHRDAWGVEISKYALDSAPEDTKPFLSLIKPYAPISKRYDWIVAKDVFEHVPYDKIDEILSNLFLTSKRGMFALIPAGNGVDYYAPDSNRDTTHIIREDLEWWSNRFQKAGFTIARSTYDVEYITRPAWRAWKRAIGFYILTRWYTL